MPLSKLKANCGCICLSKKKKKKIGKKVKDTVMHQDTKDTSITVTSSSEKLYYTVYTNKALGRHILI